MRLGHASMLPTLLVLAATAAFAQPVDTLRNGGFEKGLASWSAKAWRGKATADVDATLAKSGTRSLRMVGRAAPDTAVASQSVRCLWHKPGATAHLAGWWRGEGLVGTGGRVVVRYLGPGGKKLRDDSPITANGTFGWKRFAQTLRPPVKCTTIQVFLEIWESKGTVWFDDLSLTQEIPSVDVTKIRTGTGGNAPIRVAVYDGDAAGGTTYGETGILDALKNADGIAAKRVTALLLPVLFDFDVLVLPDAHGIGLTPLSDFAGHQIGVGTDWRANVLAFVAAGGGLLLTHDGVGGRLAFDPPLFPNVSHHSRRVVSRKVARVVPHAVTQGIKPFDHAFTDHMACDAGKDGTPILWNGQGDVLGVAWDGNGKPNAGGRVVATGIAIGLTAGDKEAAPTGAERRLLLNALRWLAKGQGQPRIQCISPRVAKVNESDECPTFQLTTIARAGKLAAQQIAVRLVDAAGKEIARHTFALPASEAGTSSATWAIDTSKLPDGTLRLVTADQATTELATLHLALQWERRADALPRAQFKWSSVNCHGPGGLKTPEDCVEMVRHTKAMGIDCLLFDGKTPSGHIYYRSTVGRPAAITEKFDPLEVTAKACKAAGIQILVQFCTFGENKNTVWVADHPDWVSVNPGESPDYRKHGHVFGCPDRPEVRAYELALIREIVTRYPVDGISFDYIRYKNDRACYCEYSERTLKDYMARHPGLSLEQARAKRASETIIGFTWDVRRLCDRVRPGLLLHGYTHPVWANEFPLDFHSQRASAHGKDPARGGQWSLERVFKAAKHNVDIARAALAFPVAAPMADTAYTAWAKSPERFRRELRLIREAGAEAVMLYPYSTLRARPELRKMIAEEFGGDPEAAAR